MTYEDLLYEISNSLRELIRSLEKESRKLIKTEWSAKYYTSHLNENMLSKHLFSNSNIVFSVLCIFRL